VTPVETLLDMLCKGSQAALEGCQRHMERPTKLTRCARVTRAKLQTGVVWATLCGHASCGTSASAETSAALPNATAPRAQLV
jgi:hypothetical protein